MPGLFVVASVALVIGWGVWLFKKGPPKGPGVGE